MGATSRGTLKGYFRKGLRPKESEFGDLIDSFYNIKDDPLNAGWMFRSVMEDLSRQGDTNLNDGGSFSFPLPVGYKELKNMRIIGQAKPENAPQFVLNLRCSYISDIQNAGYENRQSDGIRFPTFTFYHYFIGTRAAARQFPQANPAGTFDEIVPADLIFKFDQFQFIFIQIYLTNGTFLNTAPSTLFPVFYGLEFR